MSYGNNAPQYQGQAPRKSIQPFVADDNFNFEDEATREDLWLKVGVSGPSGAGKTFSSLLIAYGLVGDWSKICIIDTENKSGKYYLGTRFQYRTAQGAKEVVFGKTRYVCLGKNDHFDPNIYAGPYDPRRFVACIRSTLRRWPDIQAIIIDSGSAEWEGEGGCLDIHTRMGGQFQDWGKVTPMHRAFLDELREAPCHVIMTMRSKQEHVLEQNEKGKAKVVKKGLKATQREGVEYEFGVVFDMEIDHRANASKDRTGLFAQYANGFQITPDTGERLREWANEGKLDGPIQAPEAPKAQEDEGPETYQETLEQKKLLAGILRAQGVTDIARMKEMSAKLVSCPMDGLVAAVAGMLAPQEPELGDDGWPVEDAPPPAAQAQAPVEPPRAEEPPAPPAASKPAPVEPPKASAAPQAPAKAQGKPITPATRREILRLLAALGSEGKLENSYAVAKFTKAGFTEEQGLKAVEELRQGQINAWFLPPQA